MDTIDLTEKTLRAIGGDPFDWRNHRISYEELQRASVVRITIHGEQRVVKNRNGPVTSAVDSASDDRTANNAVRHKYRVLSDAEKAQVVAIKDKGAEFLSLIDSLRTPLQPALDADGNDTGMAYGTIDRDLNIAAERAEEAVMWAVKHITA
jgi:hypothetical protein